MKDDRDDSEGEEMEHESGESDKSSTSCVSSDGGATDSDDSSDGEFGGDSRPKRKKMDEEECEKRRAECLENLADMEKQFQLLKEQLYRERIIQVDTKLTEVRLGRSQEYLQPVDELEENCRIRIEVAGVLRELRLTNIQNKYDAEELATEQNHESEKKLLWDCIKEDLEEKIRRLEEDRNSVDISAGLWMCERGRDNKTFGGAIRRGSKQNNDSGRRKPVVVSGPYVVYMLKDEHILEDWTVIKKTLSVCKRKSEC